MTTTTARAACWQPEAECMEREELEQLQIEQLQGTLSRVARNVPFYRERFEQIGFDPDELRSIDDLRRLPLTEKRHLVDAYPYGLLAVPLREVVRLHGTGGSGDSAIVMGYTRNDIRTWSNLTARTLVAGGVTRDDVVQITFDYGLFTGALGVHYGAERLGASVIPSSSGNTKRQIKIMRDYKTTALVSTPSYAVHLAETMRAMGVNANALSLKRVLVGGEPWSEDTGRRIQEGLGVTPTDNYAVSELMGPGVAAECLERNGLHVNEDHFLVEVVDPRTLEPVRPGERGELVITTLTKEAFPIVRFRTCDLTSLLPGPCPCGRTSVRMRRIDARTDDMLIVRGVNVFPAQVEAALRALDGRQAPRHQIVLERRHALDEATVLVEVSQSVFFDEVRLQAEFRETVKRRLASELGVTFEVKLVQKSTMDGCAEKGRVVDLRGG
ncbi:MAG TPA: phenylacetate--CoA ligase [Anaeromyxobacteraceae bacterium]|nr:phenylacetate--CoA ligase [Anaeromyxobacteraceae bacterium]